MTLTIWHNPRCTKSRQTLALLEEKGLSPEVRPYLQDPPSAEELHEVLDVLGGDIGPMTRRKEAAFKEAGLTKDSSADEVIAAMVTHPILIERPIVLNNGKAAIGRPPENVLSVL